MPCALVACLTPALSCGLAARDCVFGTKSMAPAAPPSAHKPQLIPLLMPAGAGFKKVVVGQDAILATPAASALIRRRHLYGVFRDRVEFWVGHAAWAHARSLC